MTNQSPEIDLTWGDIPKRERARWTRTLSDLPLAEFMRTEQAVKPALGALWLERRVEEQSLAEAAAAWHAAGLTPDELWQLVASLQLLGAREPWLLAAAQFAPACSGAWLRELDPALKPGEWTAWPKLARRLGAFTATRIVLAERAGEHNAASWQRRPVRITELAVGSPGPALREPTAVRSSRPTSSAEFSSEPPLV